MLLPYYHLIYISTIKMHIIKGKKCFHSVVLHLKLSKVEQARELEWSPFIEVDPRTKEVECESGRHGAEQLKDRKETERKGIIVDEG